MLATQPDSSPELPSPANNELGRRLLTEAGRILLPLRQARRLPKDDKMNSGLNGLALSAFSQAAQLDPAYRQLADRLQRFVLTRLVRHGRLMKAVARGRTLPQAELEDYAYVVQGLLDHAEATGNAQSRDRARQLARLSWQLFWSEAGWKRSPAIACDLAAGARAGGWRAVFAFRYAHSGQPEAEGL